MNKLVALGAAAGIATLSLVVAAPAQAAPANAGAACVQAGLGTLKSLGVLQLAAQQKIDYSTLADPAKGPIFLSLPTGTYLSLGQVVKLHTTHPEYFAWCATS